MSKTIEIFSIHKGRVRVPVKGESRVVEFLPRGPHFRAMCDHDEAAVLLGLPGSDYWKEGVAVDSPKPSASATKSAAASEPAGGEGGANKGSGDDGGAGKDAGGEGGGEGGSGGKEDPPAPVITNEVYEGLTNLNQLRPLLKKETRKDIVAGLVTLEIGKAEPREKWIAEMNNRLAELQ